MLTPQEASLIYETLLSSPGMNDSVKISFQVPRKNVLLLTNIIQFGLETKHGPQQGILGLVKAETIQALHELAEDLLKKAGLTEMNEKLQIFRKNG